MTQRLGLLVTDASPLITLAAGEALECLTMPGLPVYEEVTRDLARIGARATTGDLLHELEAAGRIQSADRILDVAAAKDRNDTCSRTRPMHALRCAHGCEASQAVQARWRHLAGIGELSGQPCV